MGRPRTLTIEEKLRRERERYRRKKARQRKEKADAEWVRQHNSGWLENLEVRYPTRLVEFLVTTEWLDERDSGVQTRVDDAVDRLLEHYSGWPEGRESIPAHWMGHPQFRPVAENPGRVRVKISQALIDRLKWDFSLEWPEDPSRELIRELAERVLFWMYTGLHDWMKHDTYGLVWGSWNYGRGGDRPPKAKQECDPTWTDSEAIPPKSDSRLYPRPR